jgi:hypothetical protein
MVMMMMMKMKMNGEMGILLLLCALKNTYRWLW